MGKDEGLEQGLDGLDQELEGEKRPSNSPVFHSREHNRLIISGAYRAIWSDASVE